MKSLTLILIFLPLLFSSCETRDLDKSREKNTSGALQYHLLILESINSKNFDPKNLEENLRSIANEFCTQSRCLQLKILVYFKNSVKSPLKLQIGELKLEEFAYTHKEFVEQKSIELEILHGLIYEYNKPLFNKGSQIRGLIRNFSNTNIDRVETLTFLEYE